MWLTENTQLACLLTDPGNAISGKSYWRGKSYAGTLLDCTQHDWAPPEVRFKFFFLSPIHI